MKNVSHIIKRHSKQVTKTNERPMAPCNCRDKYNCPMNVYKRVVSATKISNNMLTLALLREAPKLIWSALKVVPGYSSISKQCLLCLNEKY